MKNHTRERNELLDRQTRAGILFLMKKHMRTGSDYVWFSIYYITDNQRRAEAFEKLEADTDIFREFDHPADNYPWCVFSLPETDGGK